MPAAEATLRHRWTAPRGWPAGAQAAAAGGAAAEGRAPLSPPHRLGCVNRCRAHLLQDVDLLDGDKPAVAHQEALEHDAAGASAQRLDDKDVRLGHLSRRGEAGVQRSPLVASMHEGKACRGCAVRVLRAAAVSYKAPAQVQQLARARARRRCALRAAAPHPVVVLRLLPARGLDHALAAELVGRDRLAQQRHRAVAADLPGVLKGRAGGGRAAGRLRPWLSPAADRQRLLLPACAYDAGRCTLNTAQLVQHPASEGRGPTAARHPTVQPQGAPRRSPAASCARRCRRCRRMPGLHHCGPAPQRCREAAAATGQSPCAAASPRTSPGRCAGTAKRAPGRAPGRKRLPPRIWNIAVTDKLPGEAGRHTPLGSELSTI